MFSWKSSRTARNEEERRIQHESEQALEWCDAPLQLEVITPSRDSTVQRLLAQVSTVHNRVMDTVRHELMVFTYSLYLLHIVVNVCDGLSSGFQPATDATRRRGSSHAGQARAAHTMRAARCYAVAHGEVFGCADLHAGGQSHGRQPRRRTQHTVWVKRCGCRCPTQGGL